MSEEAKASMDRDQLYHNLELRYMTLQQDAQKLRAEKDSLQKRVTESDEALAKAQAHIAEMKKAVASRDASVAEKQRLVEAKDHENKTHGEMLHRANQDLDTQKELRLASEKHVEELERRLSEIKSSYSDLQAKQTPLLVETEKLKAELEASVSRAKWAETELDTKVTELRQERQKSINTQIELQGKLDRAEKTASELQSRVSSLQAMVKDRDNLLEQRTRELKEEQARLAQTAESFDAELVAQRRLMSMHEANAREAQAKAEQHHKAYLSAKALYDEQMAKLRGNMQAQAQESQQALDGLAAKFEKRIQELENELKAANDKAAGALSAASRGGQGRGLSALIEGGMTMTEMQDRIVELDKAVSEERAEKKKLQIYVDRIIKDIESKAPVLAAHKRDYHRALVSHEQLQSRLEHAMTELRDTRRQLHDIDKEREELIAEKRQHDDKVQNLSRQIQLLLREQVQGRTGRALPPSDESNGALVVASNTSTALTAYIADDLITFRDIQELQKRNLQLQTVNSKIQRQLEALREGRGMEDTTVMDQLRKANEEIQKFTEHRQMMEAAVQSTVQQRDMFRILLSQAETQLQEAKAREGGRSGVAEAKTATPSTPTTPGRPHTSVREVQLEGELRDVQGKLSKVQELYDEAIKAGDKMRGELSSARSEAARHNADARFHSERLNIVLADAERAKQEFTKAQSKVTQSETMVLQLEKALQERGAELENIRDENRRLLAQLQQAQTEREIARSAERRLESEVVSKRAEVESLSKLVDTVNKLEASVGAKAQAETQQWEAERKSLNAQLTQARKDAAEVRAISEDRLNSLNEQLKTAKQQGEQEAKKATDLENEVQQLKVKLKAAEDKASVFEKQLDLAQRRLDGLTTSGTASAIAANEAAEKEMEVQRLNAELESTQERLKEAERHRTQYQAIASANEKAMQETKKVLEKVQADAKAKGDELQAEIESLKRQATDRKNLTSELLSENQSVKEAMSKATSQHKKDMAELSAKLEEAHKVSEGVVAIKAALHKDVERARETAKMATDNYERELQLHAGARARLADLQTQLEALSAAKVEAADKVASLQSDMAAKQAQWDDEKKRLEESGSETRRKLAELENQNGLLHSSLQSITSQLDRLQAGRLQALQTGEGGAAAGGQDATEMDNLRKGMIDLQEVVAFFRREKEVAEANKQVAEMEAARHRATVQQLQRLYDQVRLELEEERKTAQANSGPGKGPFSQAEHEQLLGQVQQLNLMRESNALLRQEKLRAESRVRELEGELTKLRDTMNPLKQKDMQAQAEIQTLRMDKESLENDVKQLQQRIQSLITRFHQIDPEDHRKLQQQAADQAKRITELEPFAKRVEELEPLAKRAEELEAKVTQMESYSKSVVAAYGRKLKAANEQRDQVEAEVTRLKATIQEKDKELVAAQQAAQQASAAPRADPQAGKKDEEIQALRTELEALRTEFETTKAGAAKATSDCERAREGMRKAIDQAKQKTMLINQLRQRVNELCVELGREPQFPKKQPPQQQQTQQQQQPPAGTAGAPAPVPGPAPAEGGSMDVDTEAGDDVSINSAPSLSTEASAQPASGPGAGAGRGRRLGIKRAPPAKPDEAGATAPAATAAQTTPAPQAIGGGGGASTEAALREALARQAAARQGVPPQAGRGQQKRPASATSPQTTEGPGKPTGAPTAGAAKKAKVNPTPTTPAPTMAQQQQTQQPQQQTQQQTQQAPSGLAPIAEESGEQQQQQQEDEEAPLLVEVDADNMAVDASASGDVDTSATQAQQAEQQEQAQEQVPAASTPAPAPLAFGQNVGKPTFGSGSGAPGTALSPAAPSFAPTGARPAFGSGMGGFGAPSLLNMGGGTTAPVFGTGTGKPSPFGTPATSAAPTTQGGPALGAPTLSFTRPAALPIPSSKPLTPSPFSGLASSTITTSVPPATAPASKPFGRAAFGQSFGGGSTFGSMGGGGGGAFGSAATSTAMGQQGTSTTPPLASPFGQPAPAAPTTTTTTTTVASPGGSGVAVLGGPPMTDEQRRQARLARFAKGKPSTLGGEANPATEAAPDVPPSQSSSFMTSDPEGGEDEQEGDEQQAEEGQGTDENVADEEGADDEAAAP